MRLAYFDCFAGAAGDMMVAALIDAGCDLAALEAELAKLGLAGYRLAAEQVRRKGLAGVKLTVDAEAARQPHRRLKDILGIIESAKLTGRAGERACAIFRRLGQAEAKVHGVGIDEVHFHEVGALDSIVDIVGICAAMEILGIEEVCCSALPVGSGTVETAHGRLPVPAPATAELLEGVPVFDNGVVGEVTTPTAAAALTVLADSFGPMPEMTVRAVGCGAGSKAFQALPNLLRVFVGERTADGTADSLVELAANVDDSSGEVIGAAIEKLLAGGCLDAWATPIVMKKSRPAWLVSALCRPDQVPDAERILFTETTTFGIRRRPCVRSKLARRWQTVETPYGPIRVKIGALQALEVSASPEFDDCLKASEAHGVSAREVAAAALEAYRRKDL